MDLFRSPGIAPTTPLPPSTFGPGSRRRYARPRASTPDAERGANAWQPHPAARAADAVAVDQDFEEYDFE